MNSKKTSGTGGNEQPTFDFTKVGRNFSREWLGVVNRATAVGKILMQLMPEGNGREALAEFEALHAEYHEQMGDLGDEQAAMICRILKTVPRSWLIDGAPSDLDWGVVESLDWIQADRYTQLLEMIGKGEHYKLSAKN